MTPDALITFEHVSYVYDTSASPSKHADSPQHVAEIPFCSSDSPQPIDSQPAGSSSPAAPPQSAASPQHVAEIPFCSSDSPQPIDSQPADSSSPAAPPAAALTDVSLEVRPASCLGVIGHTGSGKSTLVQLMNALLVPTAGSVRVCGMDTADRSKRRAVRERVGLVFQYPESQLFASTVADDLAFGPRNLGLSDEEVRERSIEAMRRVGFDYDELADRSPFALSGGQKRRVALAGVLAMRPEVLVLDEPAAGMDPQTASEIMGYLQTLKSQGLAIVMVSHSMDDVAALADDVVVLEAGEIVMHGSPAEVFSPKRAAELRRMNLGMPRAAKFAAELADRGCVLDPAPLTEPALIDALAPSRN